MRTEPRRKALVSLARMRQEASRQATRVLTQPIPLSFYLSAPLEDGSLLKYLFPVGGVVRDVVVHVGELKAASVTCGLIGRRGHAQSAEHFTLKRPAGSKSLDFQMEKSFAVAKGDRVEVGILSFEPAGDQGPGDLLSDIWIAFSFTPEVRPENIKQMDLKNGNAHG